MLFYVDNIQVLYYKDNKLHTSKVVKAMKKVYELQDIRDVEWFLRV
jgi:hypothetical protein